ncbi:MAG: hypothetical protein KBD37_05875 [Burkholderiales bacterium]|nr:hypothetical protein [Burkholderiales bacterium]
MDNKVSSTQRGSSGNIPLSNYGKIQNNATTTQSSSPLNQPVNYGFTKLQEMPQALLPNIDTTPSTVASSQIPQPQSLDFNLIHNFETKKLRAPLHIELKYLKYDGTQETARFNIPLKGSVTAQAEMVQPLLNQSGRIFNLENMLTLLVGTPHNPGILIKLMKDSTLAGNQNLNFPLQELAINLYCYTHIDPNLRERILSQLIFNFVAFTLPNENRISYSVDILKALQNLLNLSQNKKKNISPHLLEELLINVLIGNKSTYGILSTIKIADYKHYDQIEFELKSIFTLYLSSCKTIPFPDREKILSNLIKLIFGFTISNFSVNQCMRSSIYMLFEILDQILSIIKNDPTSDLIENLLDNLSRAMVSFLEAIAKSPVDPLVRMQRSNIFYTPLEKTISELKNIIRKLQVNPNIQPKLAGIENTISLFRMGYNDHRIPKSQPATTSPTSSSTAATLEWFYRGGDDRW